jgi:DNA polymerase III alpha subunit
MPCAYRRVETRGGGAMLFLTIADASGLAECALFPDALRACATAVRGQVVRVEGRVDATLDAVTVMVERAAALA